MSFELISLPYAYDALEPYIDAETMLIHHTKHHAAYVNNLNAALSGYPEYKDWTLQQLVTNYEKLPADIAQKVRNNAGGDINHTLFWQLMSPRGGGLPHDKMLAAIKKEFETFEAFQAQFNAAAQTVFGSGWAWLCRNEQGRLQIITTPNQDSPLKANMEPILALDVWEHAYYLKYQNRRPDYIQAWWHVINWDYVEDRLVL